MLTISGKVEAFAAVSPERVVIAGKTGEKIVKTIRITPQPKYPFSIKSIRTRQKGNITYSLKKNKLKQGIEYIITVENLKKEIGKYYETILIETDNPLKPEIQIGVRGRIFDGDKKQ
jgi:hypothetical protein